MYCQKTLQTPWLISVSGGESALTSGRYLTAGALLENFTGQR